ncbi:MAG: hypothetical protein HY860_02890 [Chlamydiales bacterium]|nr:hypothetical protein [Chlamydiales bacterium]
MTRYRTLLIVFLLLTACGYRLQQSQPSMAISSPYIKGDKDGTLTTSIVNALLQKGMFSYKNTDASYELIGEIKNNSTSHIGYIYRMEDNDTQVQHRLVPNEGRRKIEVEIKLVNTSSGEIVYGPTLFTTEVDYDFVDSDSFNDLAFFNSSGQEITTLSYSLGQLDSEEGAQLASFSPAYEQIAKQIADGISKSYLFSFDDNH